MADGEDDKTSGASHPDAMSDPGGLPAAMVEQARMIVFVHGIGNKPLPSILKCQWDRALFGFDLAERSRLAYWVNRLYYPDPTEATCESGDLIRLEDEPTGRSISIQRHVEATSLEEEVEAVKTDGSNLGVLLSIARRVESNVPPPDQPSVAVSGVEATVSPFTRPLREWITRKLVRAFLRDVNDFFYVDERREEMRKSLRDRLLVGGGPFVVIGHSQGSMIAYDVLSGLTKEDCEVPLFITIGSPLGIQEVQDQILRLTGQTRLAVPACVGHWLNFADGRDPVALDASLKTEYHPASQITDIPVRNPDGPRDPHSGSGYLRTPEVRTAVRQAVRTGLFQPVANFVIARDVTRQLENNPHTTRHKVLVELVEPGGDSMPLDKSRESVVAFLRELAAGRGVPADELRIEELQRFVAADLTREEVERLASQGSFKVKAVNRIWRNAIKRALLDVSARTVQALPAHAGYQAVGREIAWAVLDTGIEPHPHFKTYGSIHTQFDCTVQGPLTAGDARDRHGHGTHVAGIIAGRHAVSKKDAPDRVFSGLAPQARLHIYKVLNDDGHGEDAWIIKALDHIASTNERAGRVLIHGVNLSLGGSFDQSNYGCGHSPLCSELRRLWRQGVVVVLAAGNEGFVVLQTLEGTIDANMDLSIGDPANLEEAIAVGSVHKENPHTYGVSYFSSRGPTADGRQKPDLVAPGERILSCRHDGRRGSAASVDDQYVEMSGTSMAAPHVSGILAAFLSVRREFIGYPDRVKQILLDNCTDLKRDRPQQGAGMPNLTKMLLNT